MQAGPSLYERFADLGAKALGEKQLPFSAKSIESNIPIWSLTDPYGASLGDRARYTLTGIHPYTEPPGERWHRHRRHYRHRYGEE